MEQQLQNNLQALHITFNTLQALIKERNVRKSSDYYEAFEITTVLRILQRRIEKDSNLLRSLRRPEVRPVVPPLPEYPPVPPEVRRSPKTVQESDFFKLVWGHLIK